MNIDTPQNSWDFGIINLEICILDLFSFEFIQSVIDYFLWGD